MFEKITNKELASFLRGQAQAWRNLPDNGEDVTFWAHESNAVRCDLAAKRLEDCDD